MLALSGGSDRVSFAGPDQVLIEALFARPTALCAPQRVERSDQIEGTEATRGPRRLKGFVMAAQGEGHGEYPAAASGCLEPSAKNIERRNLRAV